MKKFLTILIFVLALPLTALADAPDLVFSPTEGKYIYCNNHEFIRRSELADNSNEHPKYIMNNSDMGADKYSIFVSHINHTEKRDESNKIVEPGFDIEIDVLFSAKEDTVINFTAAGFEVPKNGRYWYNGAAYTYEDVWGCLNCWATYLNMPIKQIDSDISYIPEAFNETEITLKAGEDFWLSEILPNYSEVPFFRPMNLMSDFEILSGKCDINVAALKSTGVLGDRSNFIKNSAFGSYDRDRQYKGVADSLNSVNAELCYEINDDTWSGISLPVKVYNQKQPNGNETTKWFTHLNPRADQWSGDICTESDMLAFKYYDPLKETCYGKYAKKDEDYSTWNFDTKHLDTSVYSKEYDPNSQRYIPNREMKPSDTTDFACNLGNYGVKLNYKISITNSGELTRYATYKLSTSSNNVVYARDADGNLINNCAVSKGVEESRVADNMVSVKLPPNETTTFTVTVILTTNYSGGMQNELMINDMPKVSFLYNKTRQEIRKDENYTGKEYYHWENSCLYLTEDGVERKITLPKEVETAVSGNWNEYRLYCTGDGYILRAGLYDGIPYYTVQDFFKTVYFFDSDFNLIKSEKFRHYPKQCMSANGVDYIYAGAALYYENGKWEFFDSGFNMPCWNYGRFSAAVKNKRIYLSADGKNFDKVKYQSFDGKYIDSVGTAYYYADGGRLYYSSNGVYWNSADIGETITHISADKGILTVNNKYTFDINDDSDIVIKADDEYLGFEQKPYLINGITYAPLRFLCESIGAKLEWDNGYINIKCGNTLITAKPDSKSAYVNGVETTLTAPIINNNGIAFAPLRWISETLGYTVSIDENGVINIK